VEGNPLENIANAHHVKCMIANGRLFDMADLLRILTTPRPRAIDRRSRPAESPGAPSGSSLAQ
jgi:hypothetical protein